MTVLLTAVVVEWDMDVVSVVESSHNVSVCASVLNPNVNTSELVLVAVSTIHLTAQGKKDQSVGISK